MTKQKGFFGGLILGICIILAVALLIGAITFPEAIGFVLTALLWVIIAIVVIVITIFVAIVLIVVLS